MTENHATAADIRATRFEKSSKSNIEVKDTIGRSSPTSFREILYNSKGFVTVFEILHRNLVSGAPDARDLLHGAGRRFVGGTLGQGRAGIGHSGSGGDADGVRGRGRGGGGGQRLPAVGP